jgi:hypothetical protein
LFTGAIIPWIPPRPPGPEIQQGDEKKYKKAKKGVVWAGFSGETSKEGGKNYV